MKRHHLSLVLHVMLLLGLLFLGGCTAPRLQHFDSFSQAGIAYTEATEQVLNQALDSSMDTDTLLLVEQRSSLPVSERGQTIIDHNDSFKKRIVIFRDLHLHAKLLRSYFQLLKTLATSDAPSGIGTAAGKVVTTLVGLGDEIQTDVSLEDIVGTGTELIVAQFQNAALETELEARATTIERELALQEEVMREVGEGLRTDLLVALNRRESNEVVMPYGSENALPADWGETRKAFLQATLDSSTLDAATSAARELRLAFVALVEGRFEVADLAALNQDLARIVTLLEALNPQETEGEDDDTQ
jgi:hypothetical protein